MKKTKIVTFIIIVITVTLLLMNCSSQATDNLVYNVGVTATNGQIIAADHPSAAAQISSCYGTFVPTENGYLTQIRLDLFRTGNPVATLSLRIETCASISTAPAGNIVATATNTIEAGSLTATTTGNLFSSFTFNGTYALSTGSAYAWILEANGATLDVSNAVNVHGYVTNTATTYGGIYYSSAWHGPYVDSDYVMQIYASGTPAPTASPTPSPTPNTNTHATWNGTAWVPYTTTEETTNDVLDYLALVILFCVCCGLGTWGAGAWGFFAGFNATFIIWYIFNSTDLWAIVLVAIVDAILLFGKVATSRHGD